MGMIKRKVVGGVVRIFGRDYCVPAHQCKELEGQELRIDADGVVSHDKPDIGLVTEQTVVAFVGYEYIATLSLKD